MASEQPRGPMSSFISRPKRGYSLENPRAYVDANIVGTFNVIECARELAVAHLLMASTSSVYGANEEMPFNERQKADTQLTLYAATKKANQSMGHSYAHLWNLPVTMFRFFTVYGPWGRPDMALFKFTRGILNGEPIDIYNDGHMYRDFTYVSDLVYANRLLIDQAPFRRESTEDIPESDSLSAAAPFRIVNIGNSEKIRLLDFTQAVEIACGVKAKRNYMEMQKGDVTAIWANADLLQRLTGYKPHTTYREGVRVLVDWYREYYGADSDP
jgi:UDP-glucuronate 4-epimerase